MNIFIAEDLFELNDSEENYFLFLFCWGGIYAQIHENTIQTNFVLLEKAPHIRNSLGLRMHLKRKQNLIKLSDQMINYSVQFTAKTGDHPFQ